MEKRLKIRIEGKVQGVTYRYNTRNFAQKNNIKGWVKNLSDGTVSVVAEGEEKDLLKLIQWCKEGPTYAKVKKIEIEWSKYIGDLNEFDILY